MAKVHFWICNYIILQLCSTLCTSDPPFSWTPPNQTRADLLCPACCIKRIHCFPNARDTDDCCLCYAKPDWEMNQDTPENLTTEYFNRHGKAIVLGSKESNFTVLKHTKGYLSQLPVNLCDFQNSLKSIDLQQNKILDIGNISCLINLDTLLLKYNSIIHIKNETFEHLNMLRRLDLSNNEIIRMEPGVFVNIEQGILHADLSKNKLQTVDVSNFIIEKPFCQINYESNSITKIVNELNWKINVSKNYGKGGMVLLGDNDFQSAIDFRELGVDDLTKLSTLIHFGFNVTGAKWNCDCKMVPFLQLAEDFVKKVWRDYFNVTCYEPEALKGRSIGHMVRDKQLDQFICDYSNTSVCPKDCYCFEQTRNNRTVVNCTSSNVRVMPDKLPSGTNLELYFGDNKITELGNKEYFQRSSILNFTANGLRELNELNVSSTAFMKFKNNSIEKIDKSFQRINPCNIELGQVYLQCRCEDIWLKDWMKLKKLRSCNTTNKLSYTVVNNVTCKNLGYISVTELTEEMLDCNNANDLGLIISTIICLVLSISFLVASLYHFFYVEIYLVRRSVFNINVPDAAPTLKYDAYVMVNDDEHELRIWTHTSLTRNLEEGGYKIFLPFRDLQLGMCREEAINEKITQSKNYIFLLSESSTPWTSLEWKYAWNQYRSDKSRNIIIVNFDQLETGEINQREIKAFSRLGWIIDFTNIRSKTLLKIRELLGTPLLRNRVGMNNANVRYRHNRVPL